MKRIALLLCAAGMSSCSHTGPAADNTKNTAGQDAAFDHYKNYFTEALWKVYPDWATSQGFHAYDSVLVIPNRETEQQRLAFIKAQQDSLAGFQVAALNSGNATDWSMMHDFLSASEWSITTFRSQEWDPSGYNYGSTVSDILNNKQAALATKLRDIDARLRRLEAYFSAAKAGIKSPTMEHTDLAISQLKGTVEFINTSLRDSIAQLKTAAAQGYAENLDKAVKITGQFVTFLAGLRQNMTKGTVKPHDFRIGKALYEQKFAFDIQSAFSAEEIYLKALKRKDELHREMSGIAKRLWPKYMGKAVMPADSMAMIKTLIGEISKTHVKRDDFQKEIEREIPVLTAFVKQKDLLYMDPSKPLVVRREPAWMAGVAGASISSPGPYDKGGNTFYNVGSLASYSPEAAESYLREYNKYILQILNIHEAIPGHYAQLVYSNQSPSIIKSILGNGAMVEGWAVYAERMMLEEGWAKNTELNGSVQEDEMWLMYDKWHLRVVCNTILDYSVHVLNMTEEKAADLLMNEAFQEKAEAAGKWRRVTLTQVQLCSYFTGFTEIYEFREKRKQALGNRFNLKAFHEQFLSYGSAPVKYIKALMK